MRLRLRCGSIHQRENECSNLLHQFRPQNPVICSAYCSKMRSARGILSLNSFPKLPGDPMIGLLSHTDLIMRYFRFRWTLAPLVLLMFLTPLNPC